MHSKAHKAPWAPRCLPSTIVEPHGFSRSSAISTLMRVSGAPLDALASHSSRVNRLWDPQSQTLTRLLNRDAQRHPARCKQCSLQAVVRQFQYVLRSCGRVSSSANPIIKHRLKISRIGTGMCTRTKRLAKGAPGFNTGSLLLITVGKTGKRIGHHEA